jgi:hypothetical protein
MGESKKCDEDQIRGEYTYREAGASEGEGGRRLKKACEEEGRIRGKGPGGSVWGRGRVSPVVMWFWNLQVYAQWNKYKRRILRFSAVVW